MHRPLLKKMWIFTLHELKAAVEVYPQPSFPGTLIPQADTRPCSLARR